MMEKEKVLKILVHIGVALGGAVVGGSVVYASTRKKYYADVEAVRTYYRNKKVVDVAQAKDIVSHIDYTGKPEEQKKSGRFPWGDDNTTEQEPPKRESIFVDYRKFAGDGGTHILQEKLDEVGNLAVNLDEPFEIEPKDFGAEEGYETKTFTHFSNGVITDENFSVVDNPDDILGDYDKMLAQDNYQGTIYIRNSTTMTDYCVNPVDKPFYE